MRGEVEGRDEGGDGDGDGDGCGSKPLVYRVKPDRKMGPRTGPRPRFLTRVHRRNKGHE